MSIFPGIPFMPTQKPLPPIPTNKEQVIIPVKSRVPLLHGELGSRTFAEPYAVDGKPVYVEISNKGFMRRQSALTKEELKERGEW